MPRHSKPDAVVCEAVAGNGSLFLSEIEDQPALDLPSVLIKERMTAEPFPALAADRSAVRGEGSGRRSSW